jgi:hypothetical protein
MIEVEKTPASLLTRDSMYALVWSEPMLKVAARYGVSSSYMARICKFMNVPRPERGYWAMVAAGKKPPILPLPDPQPGDQMIWSRGSSDVNIAKPLPRPPAETQKRRSRPKTKIPSQHPLVSGVKDLFVTCRFTHANGYLKPDKKLLVDLVVTKPSLDKALSFANKLFLSFENRGYHVVLQPRGENFCRAAVDEHEVPSKKNRDYYYHDNLWSPCRCTVAYIGTVAIGLTIIEMAEEVEVRYVNGKYIREKDYIPPKRSQYGHNLTWTTKKDYPTGRLCLQAYAPYGRAHWVKRWQETKTRELNTQIKTIVKELEEASVVIARLVEEGERQAEIERKKWEAQKEIWHKEEAARLAAKALKESREELLQIIDRWEKANCIERYFRDAEQRASALSESERLRLLERLKLARDMIGSVDALDCFLAWRAPDER